MLTDIYTYICICVYMYTHIIASIREKPVIDIRRGGVMTYMHTYILTDIYMYIYICVYIRTHIYLYLFVCMYDANTYGCILYVYIRLHIYLYLCVCVYRCKLVCMYVCMNVWRHR